MTKPSGKSDKKTTRLNGLAWRRAVQLRADGASDEQICRVLKCTLGALKARTSGEQILEALVLAEAEADGPHARRLRQWRLLLAKKIEMLAFGKVLEAADLNGVMPLPTPKAATDKGTPREAELPRSVLMLADRVGVFTADAKRRGARAHQIYAGLDSAESDDLAALGELGDWLEAA